MIRTLLCLCVVVALSGCDPRRPDMLNVTGQIEGNPVSAGSRVGGRVAEVRVEEGQRVEAGELLIQLEEAEMRAALAAAQARLAQAEAALLKAQNGATEEQVRQAEAVAAAARERLAVARSGARSEEINAARAAVDAARAQRDQASQDLGRLRRLRAENAVAQRELDLAQTAHDAAEAQLRSAQEQALALERGLRPEEIETIAAQARQAEAALDEVRRGAREEDVAAAQAAVELARADVARAEVGLAEMQVRAPLAGVVEALDAQPGDVVRAGGLVRLIDPEDLELRVFVSAVMLGHLQLGQEVPVTTDAHGSETFTGTIEYISEEGEYTPRNLQTQEERVQQVFEVTLSLGSNEGKLRAGMSATAHLPAVAMD